MDGHHFDDLTKRLATEGISRRRMLGGLAAALGAIGLARPAAAFKCAQKDQPCTADIDCCKSLTCQGGTCQPQSGGPTGNCATGLIKCKGQCHDPQTDVTNCGACGNVCAAGEGCCGGVCTPLDSTDNCGACGTVCPSVVNGSAICVGGQCGFVCNAGYTLCGGLCVDLGTDPANCGVCGSECLSGTCDAGFCACSTSTDCSTNEVCSGKGFCEAQCQTSGDCPQGYSCGAGVCGLPCSTDANCLTGQACAVTGICLPA